MYREDLTVYEVTIETMESTISLSAYLLWFFTLIAQNTISYFFFLFRPKTKKEKIVVGKVIAAKALGILILYIGKIRFVINRLGKGKRITERKEIN